VKTCSAAGVFDAGWPELLQHPASANHFVQLYQDEAFLCDAAAAYIGTALRHGEGAIVIATDAHRDAFLRRLETEGLHPVQALAKALRSAAADHHPAAGMPEGQATFLWLKRNMPRSAERILAGVRQRLATSSSGPGAPPALRAPSSTPRRA
jgi:hypothetical protein